MNSLKAFSTAKEITVAKVAANNAYCSAATGAETGAYFTALFEALKMLPDLEESE